MLRLRCLEAAQEGQQEKQLERWNRRQMAQEEAAQRCGKRAPGAELILRRVDQLLRAWSQAQRP